MARTFVLVTTLLSSCGSTDAPVLRPVYDCTQISPEKQTAFDGLIEGCQTKAHVAGVPATEHCTYRVMRAYCKPLGESPEAGE